MFGALVACFFPQNRTIESQMCSQLIYRSGDTRGRQLYAGKTNLPGLVKPHGAWFHDRSSSGGGLMLEPQVPENYAPIYRKRVAG